MEFTKAKCQNVLIVVDQGLESLRFISLKRLFIYWFDIFEWIVTEMLELFNL